MSTNSRQCALTGTNSQKSAISVFIASMYLAADFSVFFFFIASMYLAADFSVFFGQAIAANAAAHQVPPRVRALCVWGGGVGGGGGCLCMKCAWYKTRLVCMCVCINCAWYTNTHKYRYV